MIGMPFKKKIDKLIKSLSEKQATCKMRVITKEELARRYHGRFIISKNIVLILPSVNNFMSGSLDVVAKAKISRDETEFDNWWKEAVDYFEYRENEKQLEKDGKESSSL